MRTKTYRKPVRKYTGTKALVINADCSVVEIRKPVTVASK